ncbi:terminase gpA endonuclease subunit [Sphingomonas nostoxanthinifaciens]|uniref:terminase gpA endonuclease subunit n=1 Tax=Sphingomonas nostoxanthinifaciens TaxID=2872652 RepID=UPI001CC217F1|nr:terminase gpA endonuclease subunit [Sphingomonas nostoxanthinifaciens]UAK24357.1 phage terminase large subunit family protein [Sphingomonas nostoxanthinifaciens]
MATAAQLPAPRWSIPPFETGAQIFARLAHLVAPREKLTVSQWARRNTSFDLDALPWHAEVMDALSDPDTAEVGLLGPAQAGKSTIGLSWLGWVVDQAPDNFFLCQPDRSATSKFVVSRVDPFIKETSSVKTKLLDLSNANNMFLKQFQGMFLYSVWPVPGQFIQVPARYGWLDDFDQMDDDIGGTEEKAGQGSAIKLVEGRLTTRKGRDTKFVSSSPADETGGKTEAFVEGGTDERLHPECPTCGDRWAIDIRRDLRFDDTGDEDLAERTAHVICGANGCLLDPADRRALLNSLARLPRKGFVPARPGASNRRRSFRVDGLLAFTTWPDLAREWREAQRTWATRQDEAPLRTFMNTKAGVNYRSILSGEKPLETESLLDRREKGWKAGTVPAGVKVVVTTVDVQQKSFQCATIGIGEKRELWLIDRWSIDTLSDGLTTVQPLRYREHWSALLPLFSREWKLADGSGRSVRALTVAIDARGGESDLAIGFWHMAAAAGIHPTRVTLLQGGNNPKAALISPARRSDQRSNGGQKRNSPGIWTINVHWLKNILDAMLRRDKPGPGYVHLAGNLAEVHVDEITAEQLDKGKWKKIRPRNETWDLLVYALAAILRRPFAQSRLDMRWVPPDFRVPDPIGPAAAEIEPDEVAATVAAARPAPVKAKTDSRKQLIRTRPSPNWLNRRGR